jgi:hypothetical protein
VTVAQIASILVQAGLLLMGGVLGLLVRGAIGKLKELTDAVRELSREVAEQGKELAGGEQRFTDHERRLTNLERKAEDVARNGCGRARDCG